MTRHMRNIAKSRTTSRRYAPGAHAQVIEANNTIVSAELATAWLKTTRDIETAHAIALEREAICKWLDMRAENLNTIIVRYEHLYPEGSFKDQRHLADRCAELAGSIRSGAHWEAGE